MNIVVCGECYSPNLGDGVIALGIERLIRLLAKDAEIRFFDLSGRVGFPKATVTTEHDTNVSKARALRQRVLRSSYLAGATANFLRYRRTPCGPADQDVFSGADRIIVGGGQLLQDNRLAFPSVLSRLIEIAQRRKIPVTVFSVGVGSDWSALGRYLIDKTLTNDIVDQIFCRDEASATRLRNFFPNITAGIGVTSDAALAIDAAKWKKSSPQYRLGMCVMHPATIRWTNAGHPLADYSSAVRFWVDLYLKYYHRGMDVRLFTNGAQDDQQFANDIFRRIRAESTVHCNGLLPRPVNPGQLVETIADFEILVANRLHANVIATALEVHNVALGWDTKVESFMAYTGQSEWFAAGDAPTNRIVDIIDNALTKSPRNVQIDKLVEGLLGDMASAIGVRAAEIDNGRLI